ncbi:peptide deformylase [Lacticaseibacillus hulanensis]|jgi:peptide deformylase|uniref:peptide deformylase n=1 Tax=Lacticaseibacillus hulanensis TaxID=2493111 RepID=UPI000FDBFF24|nr:peptide deformylase [Lacticaseibacillus hulanensis]
MIRDINRNPLLLSKTAEPATRGDKQIITDLQDTLRANADRCVGMAANMIGENKNIIIVQIGPLPYIMVNPQIISKANPYRTEEGCLSLDGQRAAKRFKQIRVHYFDQNFAEHEQEFSDFTAQIIQHEVDHCAGILI